MTLHNSHGKPGQPWAQDALGGRAGGVLPEQIVAGFAQMLRLAGLSVPTSSVITFAEALTVIGMSNPKKVYWAGRATLISRFEDIATYDRVFSSYWSGSPDGLSFQLPSPPSVELLLDDPELQIEDGDDLDKEQGEHMLVRYSPLEVLLQKDLGSLSSKEWTEAQRLISAMKVCCELRRTRRSFSSQRRRSPGARVDLRGTVRKSISKEGLPLDRVWRNRAERPRRLVFIVDVSGSMQPYARGLVLFAHAALSARHSGLVEAFALGTRLTRLTGQLSCRDPEAALREVSCVVADWSGGTRLGAGIREFNDQWGAKGLARGAVVVICSDGWDRGEPELLGTEMARLARLAHKIIWVNPLKASPGYAPLARGMSVALPYVDDFLEGHAICSLEELAKAIGGRASKVRIASPRERLSGGTT
jgi:uncharacterized protein with von Willebrand factor type A (vWA) domain